MGTDRGPREIVAADDWARCMQRIRTLCEHRNAVFVAFAALSLRAGEEVWRSRFDVHGAPYERAFVLGIGGSTDDCIAYGMPLRLWDACDFADELDRCPVEGIGSDETLRRLLAVQP